MLIPLAAGLVIQNLFSVLDHSVLDPLTVPVINFLTLPIFTVSSDVTYQIRLIEFPVPLFFLTKLKFGPLLMSLDF